MMADSIALALITVGCCGIAASLATLAVLVKREIDRAVGVFRQAFIEARGDAASHEGKGGLKSRASHVAGSERTGVRGRVAP